MKTTLHASVLIFMAFGLTACGTIRSFFPDKEKDYRFTSELPPLVLPNEREQASMPVESNLSAQPVEPPAIKTPQIQQPELSEIKAKSSAVQKSAVGAPLGSLPEHGVQTTPLNESPLKAIVDEGSAGKEAQIQQPEATDIKAKSSAALKSAPVASVADNSEPVPPINQASLVKPSHYGDDVAEADALVKTRVEVRKVNEKTSVLHINQTLPRSWRMVGKALSQNSIEITERSEAQHAYLVQYEANAKALKDDSIWDDILFVFGSENNNEQQYRILLSEKDHETTVRLLNTDKKLCDDENCAKLLLIIKNTIEKSVKD